ncbi:MAG: TOBE domain-containing protein, partial [Deltaproteobacteria bacterium]|nr:TOBE domain-containing protein [Deltaproteobacteria bacterium]
QGSVRLAVDPERAVLLLKGQAPGRNTLSGRVTQLTEERGQVRVRVDVGFPMAVLVSSAGADALRVGQRVRVHIPPEALSVL